MSENTWVGSSYMDTSSNTFSHPLFSKEKKECKYYIDGNNFIISEEETDIKEESKIRKDLDPTINFYFVSPFTSSMFSKIYNTVLRRTSSSKNIKISLVQGTFTVPYDVKYYDSVLYYLNKMNLKYLEKGISQVNLYLFAFTSNTLLKNTLEHLDNILMGFDRVESELYIYDNNLKKSTKETSNIPIWIYLLKEGMRKVLDKDEKQFNKKQAGKQGKKFVKIDSRRTIESSGWTNR